ncbi:GNAT family N-acetyltransferase [Bosea minatitlanensis]|uniref:GNAT family N-acetyltransferase n=1 Tax=Bosea minatitlanensis TaxID=128782 RepID=A0ABW0FAI1_9HYPH|nr:GNAT family N-acetyltransferase [Bosea minatitlanensis]MCT4495530.1 GNAT family N-acetyltransferase [Bosea minatitlanensis]
MPASISLRIPDRALLDAYEAALRGGWSPNTTRDVAPEQLAAIAADPDAFLAEIRGGPGRVRLPDGREVDRIPGPTRWIFAEDRPERPFIGSINLRWQEDAEGRPMLALPEHVLGHIGYTILPAFAGHGYATAALAAMLGVAREAGLPDVIITCDEANHASRRVIEKNGGRLVETFVAPLYGPARRLRFMLGTAAP